MTDQPLHGPTEAAALITDPRTKQPVNAYTLRRWCAAHALHLSAGANPGKDAPRRLTERDVEVLRAVAELRGEGLATDAINARLATLAFAVVDNVDIATSESLDTIDAIATPTQSQASQDVTDSPSLLPVVLSGIDARFNALQADIARIEAASKVQAQEARDAQRDRVTMLVLGGLGGMLLTVGALAVWVWMMGNG